MAFDLCNLASDGRVKFPSHCVVQCREHQDVSGETKKDSAARSLR